MDFELPRGFRPLAPEDVPFETRPDEDEQIPEGTFFAASPHTVETMTPDDAQEYADFFAMVLQQSPHYTDEEKEITIELRTAAKNIAKLVDSNWIMLTVKEKESGAMIGSLEARTVVNNDGERYGLIHWTLAHPEHRREGIATQLKLQLESILKERGCLGIITGIRDANTASIEMNRALGVLLDDSFPRTKDGIAWYTKRF